MNLLYGLLSGLAWLVVAVFGAALSPTELANMLAVARRWLGRLGRALWPDVRP